MSTAPLGEIRGLSKRFGSLAVLDRVAFTIGQGEIVGLIGPNGAGKTTLLECMAGLLPTDGGEFLRNGIAINRRTRRETLLYVPDGIEPWEHESVEWVMRFFEALHQPTAAHRMRLVEELALADLLQQPIGTLSRGQRKRVIIALGLLTAQPLLLLDEPFDGLDVRQIRELATVLRLHAELGRTMLLSIHQLVDAERVCDRMVLLSNGKVVGQGTLPELQAAAGLRDGSLEEVFLALT